MKAVLEREVQREIRALLLRNRSTYVVGQVLLACVFTGLTWHLLPRQVMLTWMAAAFSVAGLYLVALYTPLARVLRRDGLPVWLTVADVAAGLVYGATVWLDRDGLRQTELSWICLVTLFAAALGTQTVAKSGTPHPITLQTPMWLLAVTGYLSVGSFVVALGLTCYVAIFVRNHREGRDLFLAGMTARVHEAQSARTDALTGLTNRRAAMDTLAELATDEFTVLYIDLDHFKPVNDAHGHRTGDALLVAVAERISAVCREGDLVARLGGDEFLVAFRCEPERGLGAAARLAQRIVETVSQPFHIDGHELRVSASVGIAGPAPATPVDAEHLGDASAQGLVATADLPPGSTDALDGASGASEASEAALRAQHLVARADSAMYAAKHSGRGRVRVSIA